MNGAAPDYAFLDCGDGRRLERLGGVTVSRPAPAAGLARRLGNDAWDKATLAFTRESGWTGTPPEDWRVCLDGATLALRPATGGQIGVFPEHARVASALLERAAVLFPGGRALSALNLFAHTGLVTLRLAGREGMAVTHVDAAPASVKAARENAVLSGLAECPVRWLVDDAVGFARREMRRGKRYQIIAADPPAFGRAGKGKKEWKLERDLPELVALLLSLLDSPGILALSCHREGWTVDDVARMVSQVGGGIRATGEALSLAGTGGNSLSAGVVVYAEVSSASG